MSQNRRKRASFHFLTRAGLVRCASLAGITIFWPWAPIMSAMCHFESFATAIKVRSLDLNHVLNS